VVELCQKSDFKKAILAEMEVVGKAAKLRGFEYVKTIHLEPQAFGLENGLLTPTFKLKRNEAAVRILFLSSCTLFLGFKLLYTI
jgi:long-chain acyl-CoA synthetase